MGKQAFLLRLLQDVRNIHDVFHMSLLELYFSDKHTAPDLLLRIELYIHEKYELKAILESDYRCKVLLLSNEV